MVFVYLFGGFAIYIQKPTERVSDVKQINIIYVEQRNTRLDSDDLLFAEQLINIHK